jgi:hypothetical protein
LSARTSRPALPAPANHHDPVTDLVRNVAIIGLMIAVGYLVGFRFTGGVTGAVACIAVVAAFGPCMLREAMEIIDSQPRAARVRDRRRRFVDNTDRGSKPAQADGDPRPAAVTFVTTEHFTLQGARAQTVSESTMRASVFLGAVSGGLIALGLVATAAKTGVAFYAFGLILGAGGRRCRVPGAGRRRWPARRGAGRPVPGRSGRGRCLGRGRVHRGSGRCAC